MLAQKQNTSLLLMKVRTKVCMIFSSIVKNMHIICHAYAPLENDTLCLCHLLSIGKNDIQISPQFVVSLVVLSGTCMMAVVLRGIQRHFAGHFVK
jgi:hypothetical protein